jgi:sulfite reductase (NADPH) flavoprotein alpha-component
MAFAPRLPDSAPFTANQRAWLDGFLAGWFSFEGDTVSERSPLDMPMVTLAEAEDFPW